MFNPNSTRLDGRDRTAARIGVRLDADTRAELEAVARSYHIPISEAARQAIRDALAREMSRDNESKRTPNGKRTRPGAIKVRAA